MHSSHPTALLRLPSFLVVTLLGVSALLAATPSVVAAQGPLEAADRELLAAPRPCTREDAPGYDISYPQCGGPFPSPYSFAIVGVNGGRVFGPNPCLGTGNGPSQLAWAGVNAQLYANTGNPGPELSSFWPHGQTLPRECNTEANPGADTADCAFDYGWNAAADSYRTAVAAYISLGWAASDATRTPVANTWWLDVETANSWRTDTSLNVAALQGAVAYLASVEAAGIGFYSTQYQWDQITGGSLAFSAYPSWHAGARTLRGAKANCADPAFTGAGRPLMTQYFEHTFDANYLCL